MYTSILLNNTGEPALAPLTAGEAGVQEGDHGNHKRAAVLATA